MVDLIDAFSGLLTKLFHLLKKNIAASVGKIYSSITMLKFLLSKMGSIEK
jgi:hypothetical protein